MKALTKSEFIQWALEEDLPNGDMTTDSLGISQVNGQCQLVAKQDLVLSGKELFALTMQKLEPQADLSWHFSDGDAITKTSVVCNIQGNLIDILKAERVALNYLGHLSGIATLTHAFVEQAKKIKILDTRKTLPLYRQLEKQAVRDGGGYNHRMTLSDAILVKENHIRAIGSLEKAIKNIQANHPNVFIEVEVQTLAEAKEAVALGAQRLLLDNMDNQTLKACVEALPANIQTEASGNITLERICEIDSLGVDCVSIGALNHSAPCADFSLLFHWDS